MSDPAAQLFGVGGLSPASSGLGQGAGPEVAAGSALVTGALSIDAQLKAGREAKREARNQAAEVKQIAEEEAALEGRRTARLLASARAGFAGAGFEFAGSPLIFLRQIELEGEEQIGLIRQRAGSASVAVWLRAWPSAGPFRLGFLLALLPPEPCSKAGDNGRSSSSSSYTGSSVRRTATRPHWSGWQGVRN